MISNEKMIERREMMTNGSGYYDFTAYLAIKDIQEGVIMGVRADYADGDIVTVEKNNGYTEEMLLLKCHDGYASATILREKEPYENGVPVISRQKMYADAGRLCYVFYDMITGFVKAVPDDELEKVRRKIGEALGIGTLVVPAAPQEVTQKSGADEEVMAILDAAIQKMAESADTAELKASLIRAEAERDVYRDLFEKERAGK